MYAQVCNGPPIRIKIWLHFFVTTTSTKQSPSWEHKKFLRESRNSPNCREPGCSLPRSQEPVTCMHSEPDQSSPRQNVSFPQVSPTSLSPNVPHAPTFPFFFFTFVWPCIVTTFFITKPTRCTNFTNLFWYENLHASGQHMLLLESCLQTCMTYTTAECTVNNYWWWAEELPETCRFLCQNKFVKLVNLFGFIIKKLPILLHWITTTVSGEKYKSCNSSLCSFTIPLLPL
jgi:hypothetical protein